MNKRTAIFALSLLALVGTTSLLGACNTTAGAGKDIAKTGQVIERTANQNTPR
jgi:predicted small secreted protein